jgi:hypothetical protein
LKILFYAVWINHSYRRKRAVYTTDLLCGPNS